MFIAGEERGSTNYVCNKGARMTSHGQAWASSGKNVIRLFGHHFAIAHIENHTIKRK